MATKPSNVPVTLKTDFVSITQGAYIQAVYESAFTNLAKLVIQKQPSILTDEKFSDEIDAELSKGYFMRVKELPKYKEQIYLRINGGYILEDITNPAHAKVKDKIKVNADYVMHFASHEVTALKRTDEKLYDIVRAKRKEISTYISDRKGDLLSKIKKISKSEDAVSRQGKSFNDYVLQIMLDDKLGMVKRCNTASSKRGDATADTAKIKKAVDAFMKEWNAK